MAKKAHHRHWEAELGRRIERDDSRLEEIEAAYRRLVEPWLSLNAVVGNIYTGSLFLCLIDYLRRASSDREGSPVSLFSYGSGCGASFSAARLSAGASAYGAAVDPEEHLAARKRLSIEQYEQICAAGEAADLNDSTTTDPARWGLSGDLHYVGTVDHQRRYAMRR